MEENELHLETDCHSFRISDRVYKHVDDQSLHATVVRDSQRRMQFPATAWASHYIHPYSGLATRFPASPNP